MKIAQPIINEIMPESSALLIFRGALIIIIICNATASTEQKGPIGKQICTEFKLARQPITHATTAAAQKI